MIFFDNFENRLKSWVDFRSTLETEKDPLQKVINFWNRAPIGSRTCDPFDQSTWPDPWEIIADNNYCEFTKILAMYYTLALTDTYKECYYEIQIAKNSDAHEILYLLIIDDQVLGYHYDRPIFQEDLPTNLNIQASYPMLDDKFI
jgi:hypothetical protein